MTDITARLAEARESFERHFSCSDPGVDGYNFRKLSDGSYYLDHIEMKWEGWQAALAAYESERVGWQPIETAPRSVDVLLCCPRAGVVRGRWQPDTYTNKPRPYWTHDRERLRGVRETRADQPTHWQPLPAAPVQP